MKAFDCVAMKRRGAERVREATAGMTRDEELEFWARGTRELLEFQESVRSKQVTGPCRRFRKRPRTSTA